MMRLGSTLIVLGLVAFGCRAQPAATAEDTLAVATYNVENLFDNFDDPYKPDEGTSPKSLADLAVLAKTIDRLDADVLALQEVENLGALERLNRALAKPYPFVEILPGNDGRGIHCALLSRVRVRRSIGHRTWPLAGERRFARDLPVYEIEPSPGRRLLVAPVHFKSKRTVGSDAQGNAWRTAEAAGTIEVLADLRRRGMAAPFVLLGDLNDERLSDPLRPLFDKLEDATVQVPDAERYTYVWSGRKQQIDWVLYDGALTVRNALIVHDPDAASDHAPIVTRFAWPEPVRRVPGPSRVALAGVRRPKVAATDTKRLRELLLREVEAKGRVVAVEPTQRGGHFNVRFARDARRALALFVPRDAVRRFPDLARLVGEEITVTGPVFVYRGRLEISLTRPEQLR